MTPVPTIDFAGQPARPSFSRVSVWQDAATAVFTALQTPQYASSARLFISTSQTDDNQLLQGGQFSAQRVKSYADLITSRELAKRVIADTGLDVSADDMTEKVSAEAVLDTVNLDITVTETAPLTLHDRCDRCCAAAAGCSTSARHARPSCRWSSTTT